ncbi:MAG: hypothetical protein AB1801_25215 [Chloroflexota bacterium]
MSKSQPTRLQQLVYHLLLENTGIHLLDSGDAYGRHWQKNQGKTIHDFINEPAVKFDLMVYKQIDGEWQYTRVENTEEIDYTISVFHYLTGGALELDPLCDRFNARPVDNWDFEGAYGVSKHSGEWLSSKGAQFGTSFNTYNHASALSQVLQGTYVTIGRQVYVLLQVHGGCDLRGGYTDAKLFALSDPLTEGYMPPEDVYGLVTMPDKQDRVIVPMLGQAPAPEPIWISNTYNGYSLTDDEGRGVKIGPGDQVELFLGCSS